MTSGILISTQTIHQGNTFAQDGFYSKPSLEKLYEYASKNKGAKPFGIRRLLNSFNYTGK